MFKRVTIVALVVAAFLVLAVPAMAWNGLREDYTTSEACQTCHSGIAGIPATYQGWSETKHGETGITANRAPYGSVCSGCHSSNFDPSKPTPTPSGTTYAWANATPIAAQALGTASVSENGKIGCSACHYGANVAGGLEIYGVDSNDTAHNAPYGELANADICGACHSRYSYTVDTYAVNTIPGAATPTPLIQPQMALGYPMLGSPAPSPATGWTPAAPLAAYLNVPHPGWTPTPNPSATSAAGLMTFWQMPADGTPSAVDTMWQAKGHDGSASQYPEWANEGHANALTALTSMPFWASFPEATKQECLECHSADFRIMKESGKNPTSADVKYGVTCVGCHTPHEAGDITGVWDEEFDAQLVNNDELGGNGSNLCTECHNGEIPAGSTASPGAEVQRQVHPVPHGSHRSEQLRREPHLHHHRAGSRQRGRSDPGRDHDRQGYRPADPRHDEPAGRDHYRHDADGTHAVLGVQHVPRQQPEARAADLFIVCYVDADRRPHHGPGHGDPFRDGRDR
jgi:nitrate/TMAO reductase-like tetraheme cytochrome c subunit